jgi:hypothetical protein
MLRTCHHHVAHCADWNSRPCAWLSPNIVELCDAMPCCVVLCCAVLCCAAGFLMLCVNWSAIHAECLMPHERTHSCDLLSVAIHKHPLRDHSRGLVGF